MLVRSLLKKIFGSKNQRTVKKYSKLVKEINALEQDLTQLSNEGLLCKTNEFKNRVNKGESLDSILPEAFAVVREAAKRTMGMRHFDVQLIGGIALHSGKIAEMHTGEGKTLMATLPAYLNALSGKSVHIVTVNDYLAKRDANWMRPIYEMLGMRVGIVIPNMATEEKRENYSADIVYGTNNEYGFDYLRDNMAYSVQERVQKDRNFAIIDEVDSILIDEARTPLIISGPAENSSDLYTKLNVVVPLLTKQVGENGPGHFSVDEKHKQVQLTEEGHDFIEKLLVEHNIIESEDSLYSPNNISIMHHLNAALRAHNLFHIDVDYIVANNEIVIVDEHTGRTMPGRRWSDGLHQAIEAKEKVGIKQENQTLASITFQNYFRLYNKLSGMTGTADTEAFEFQQIYGLEVVVIPTNKPVVRIDQADQIYLTSEEKFNAIVADIKARREKQQPVLLGTASIETSEYLSKLLDKNKIPHQVLNAKFHQKEAEIIVDAGRPGVVTIATNMAGRGTDIVLGGNLNAEIAKLSAHDNVSEEEINQLKADWQKRHDLVLNAGGLYVLGSERHESRRIDNQLLGRSGRQGDAGETRFYLSMDDNLMRIFASDRMKNMMASLGMAGNAIESKMITRSIKGAQHRVEGLHFEIRKQLLEYDDIANEQRKIIYDQRDYLMTANDVHETVLSLMESIMTSVVHKYMPPNSLEEQWDVAGLQNELVNVYHLDLNLTEMLDSNQSFGVEEIVEKVSKTAIELYQQKQANFEPNIIYQIEKSVLLQVLDNQWKDHLVAMDHLRQSVGLRGYAQKDPKQEYKREAFYLFESLLENYRQEVCSILLHYNMFSDDQLSQLEDQKKAKAEREQDQMQLQHSSPQSAFTGQNHEEGEFDAENDSRRPEQFIRDTPKVGRNEKCYCGSGHKYKNCHGLVTSA